MVKEDVLNALNVLGFIPIEMEGFGFQIHYEGRFLIYTDVEDTESVNFVMPNIFEITDENREAVYKALIELGGKIKYVQSYIVGDNSVWINYVHYVGENEVKPELIEHIITVLMCAAINFHKIINSTFAGES